MTDIIPQTLEHAVLSMCPKSKDHVTADLMCKVALSTKLELFSSAEFRACPKPDKPGIYVVPVQDEDKPVRLMMFDVTASGSRIRDTEILTSAGWAVACRWLFKRRPYAP